MSTLTKDQARGLILAVKKGLGWKDIGAKLGRKPVSAATICHAAAGPMIHATAGWIMARFRRGHQRAGD